MLRRYCNWVTNVVKYCYKTELLNQEDICIILVLIKALSYGRIIY